MSKKFTGGSVNGKGYYIALILCAVAIGITGYLYYRSANTQKPQLQGGDTAAVAEDPQGGDVQAVATQPGGTTAPTELPKPKMKTAAPVSGKAVAGYAMDCLSYNETTRDWRTHSGADYAAAAGTKVCAAADGTVYTVYEDDTMGTTVVIRHDGDYVTKYASLAKEVSVKAGDKVTVGQAIGCVGETALLENALGPHVHFSVTCGGSPVDPAEFLPES